MLNCFYINLLFINANRSPLGVRLVGYVQPTNLLPEASEGKPSQIKGTLRRVLTRSCSPSAARAAASAPALDRPNWC